MPKVKIELSTRDFKKVADYLSHHENDIAIEENDFAELKPLYLAIFEEEAKSYADYERYRNEYE